ncbi:melatonin-related receptor [Aplysia californica]|uniref:Melatonin-related receptor n=1 Tax=Aplysia californica TaxID=6500 RepID=A0ABM1W0I9_APLCA|nr:melatonin-related receptor [Aplysia californica]
MSLPSNPPLIESDFSMAVIYVTLMVIALSVGTVGNSLILLASACVKSLRKSGYIFIINLALADMCVAAIADPMCVIAVLKGEEWFNDKPWFCETVAAMCLTACFCAFLSLSLATVNRYVFVCHNLKYDRIFQKKICIILCIAAWLLAFFFESPNFFGELIAADAPLERLEPPMTAIKVISGQKVLIQINTKFNLYHIDQDDPARMKKVWNETVKSSRMLFIIFVIFVVLWTPYAVVIAADVQNTMPTALHLFVTMLAHLHSSVNFCVYIICNRNFRRAVLRLLCCRSCTDTTSTTPSEAKSTGKLASVLGSSQYATASDRVASPANSLEA